MVADAYSLMQAVLTAGVDSEAVRVVLDAVERGELSEAEAAVALKHKQSGSQTYLCDSGSHDQ